MLISRNTLTVFAISFLSAFGASADFLMELRNTDGTLLETQCVKSYSYSNNLESIQNLLTPKGQEYSHEETLTDITYLGRPVYRRLISIDGVYNRTLGNYPEIDFLVRDAINMRYTNGDQTFSDYNSTSYFANVTIDSNKNLKIVSNFSTSWDYFGEVVIEYTKVGDEGQAEADEFKEFVHYTLSSSQDDSVVTHIINEKLVTFTAGYTFDETSGLCQL